MTADRGAALRRLRGELSARAFATLLVAHGLDKGALNRHRLADAELGKISLREDLWDAIAHALIAAGYDVDAVAALRSTEPPIEPLPPPTPRLRRDRWYAVVERVEANDRWWRPLDLISLVTDAANLSRYQRVIARHRLESTRQLRTVRARLELGAAGRWQASADDRIALDRTRSEHSVHVGSRELFLLRLRLHNAGTVPWRDRLLYRVGAPVSTGTPFTPGVLPVPDTEPGQDCEVLIPGRAQWFRSLAAIHFVMVFPDCTPCLPGRVCCWVDTRTGKLDKSLPLES